MTDLFAPPGELVAVGWLKAVLAPFDAVGNSLPANSSWPEGFVQVMVAGGSPLVDIAVRRPVFSVDVWVASTNSSTRPPWGRASVLTEQVRIAAEKSAYGRVDLPTGYRPAVVTSAIPRTEPRRIPNDPGGFAHFSFDLELHWREAS